MLKFTYNDYLDCVGNKKILKAIKIENKRNQINKNFKQEQYEQNNKIDKIIDKLIEKEAEVANFINDFFKTKDWEINSNTLKRLHIQNKSIIYQYKKREIYFLIKHQKEPNYSITYSILVECTEFIQNWKTTHVKYKQAAIIVPIIIYTGTEKWNKAPNNYIRYTSFKEHGMNLTYNFINLQNYEPINLIKNKSLISSVSLLKMQISKKMKKNIIELLKEKTKYADIYVQIQNIEEMII